MVDTLGIQLLLQVVDELRVGHVGQLGLGVVRQEGVENVLRIVEEVEDESRLAVAKGTVQARQGLHAVHALQLLVHIHGAQLGLIEAGLVLVGGDHHVEVLGVEGLCQVTPVQAGIEQAAAFRHLFGDHPVRQHTAGEGHQRVHIAVAHLLHIGLHRQLVAHRLLPAAGDHHGLGLAAQQVADIGAEVLDDHLHLLADVVRMQTHPARQLHARLFRVHFLVVTVRVGDLPGGAVGGVVLQHIEDETFLDGLAHGVQVERLGLVVGARRQCRIGRATEQLQGLGLGRGGKGVVADALVGRTGGHGGVQQLFGADLLSIRRIAAENLLELAGR